MKVRLAELEEALRKSGGVMAGAAELLTRQKGVAVSRALVWKRVQTSPRLQRVVVEADETVNDLAESKLLSAINRGQAWAVSLRLKTKARHRGYVERQETIDLSKISDEELERLERIVDRLPGADTAAARAADGDQA